MRLDRLVFLFACLAPALPAWAGIPASCSQTPPTGDRANAVVSGSFTGTGHSTCFAVQGQFNVTIYGSSPPQGTWSATVQLERSFDGGTTWIIDTIQPTQTQAIWSTASHDVSTQFFEPEAGVLYRLDCTAFTSGTANYRMSTTGRASGIWAPTP